MKTNPLVSVVIDNYNYGHFLAKAIDSVLQQTYQNFEVIVVDDGSTDHSYEIIQSYGNRIVPIFQENSGQSAALNVGIHASKGEIICFLDADDYFQNDKLEKVVNSFHLHPEWVQISHYCIPVDANEYPIQRGVNRKLSQGNVTSLLLKHGKYGLARTSALAYRHSALKNVFPIPSERSTAADSYLMATVPFYGEVGFINETLMYYRIHGNNKHAHSVDKLRIESHLQERRFVASYINQVARANNLKEQFQLSNDADYCTFDAIQRGLSGIRVKPLDFFKILYLIIQESIALQRPLADIFVRLTWSSLCILYPSESQIILGLGLKKYLQSKLKKHQSLIQV